MTRANRRVVVTLDANTLGYDTRLLRSAAVTKAFAHEVDSANRSMARNDGMNAIDKNFGRFTSRLHLALDLLGSIGPAFVPIGAAGIPVITGLAAALGTAAVAGGTAVLAFQGIGDALSKLNKAKLDPTEAKLKAAHLAMEVLGQDAKRMVRFLSGLTDEMHGLRDAAASGLFPGLHESIETILDRAPQAQFILEQIGEALGDLAVEGANDLTSERWDDFFTFLGNEAPDAIAGLGEATGNLAHAMAELTMAFAPLNGGFLDAIVKSSAAVDKWATGLSKTEGFQEFVAYIEKTGPEVADLLGSISMALVHIVEAASTVGQFELGPLTALFDAVGALAGSNLGGPLVALLALTKTMALLDRAMDTKIVTRTRALGDSLLFLGKNATSATTTLGSGVGNVNRWNAALVGGVKGAERYNESVGRIRSTIGSLAKSGGIVAGFMAVQSGLTEQIGLTNTVIGASIGLMGGPWAAAIGAGIGLLMDLAESGHQSTLSVESLTDAIDAQTGALSHVGYDQIASELQFYQGALDDVGVSLTDATIAVGKGGPALEDLQNKVQGVIDKMIAAKPAIDDIRAGMGVDQEGLASLGALQDALSGANSKLNDARAAKEKDAAASAAAADANRDAAQATNEWAAASHQLNAAIKGLMGLLKDRELARNYASAWKDLLQTVKQNKDTVSDFSRLWDKGFKKGNDDLEKLDAFANAAGQQIANLEEKGRHLAAQRILDQAIHDLQTFKQMFPGAAAAVDPLIQKLQRANQTNVKPKVDVNTDDALHKLGRFQGAVDSLHGKNIEITVTTTRIEKVERQLGPIHVAGGGLIRGPGTATSDSIPANLSDGEFVMKASAVKKYGVGMFQRMNMAGGGLASKPGTDVLPMPGPGGTPKYDEILRGFDAALQHLVDAVDDGGKKLDKALKDFHPKLSMGVEGVAEEIRDLKRAVKDAGGKWTKEMQHQADKLKQAAFAHDLAKAGKKAIREFDIDPAAGVANTRSELHDLKSALKDAGGKWTHAMQHQADKLVQLSAAYDAQVTAVEQSQQALDAATGALSDLQSKADAFGQQVGHVFDNTPFGRGLEFFDLQTEANTNDTQDFQSTLQQLVGMGLDGPLLEQLAASGDLSMAMQLLATGPAGIAMREQAFASLLSAQQQLGVYATQQVFGDRITAATAAVTLAQTAVNNNTAALGTLATQMGQVETALEANITAATQLPANVHNGAHDGSFHGVKQAIADADIGHHVREASHDGTYYGSKQGIRDGMAGIAGRT